jgi:hypothetical protein
MNEYYYYGLAATLYITTCWTFAVVRWFHTCNEPKERHSYIWPDRKLQCLAFQRRYGSFASYINSLRLAYYDQYMAEHPDETKESAALASGFSNYMAYYRAKQRQ